jgi:hypothetical protein
MSALLGWYGTPALTMFTTSVQKPVAALQQHVDTTTQMVIHSTAQMDTSAALKCSTIQQ